MRSYNLFEKPFFSFNNKIYSNTSYLFNFTLSLAITMYTTPFFEENIY